MRWNPHSTGHKPPEIQSLLAPEFKIPNTPNKTSQQNLKPPNPFQSTMKPTIIPPMQFYKLYNQENYSEVENLIKFCTTCNLITSDQNQIQTGLFNPIFTNGKLYLHLNKKDQQVTHMKNTNSATMVFQDVLAQFPSYWADENYAGAATTYYRYAELNCKVSFFDDPNQQIPILESMMVDYQPEGKYQKISYDNPIYTKKLDMILIADFEIIDFKAKWKLGQNRPVEFRKEISEKFRARNEGSDKRCADEIEKWIGQHCGNL